MANKNIALVAAAKGKRAEAVRQAKAGNMAKASDLIEEAGILFDRIGDFSAAASCLAKSDRWANGR